MSRTGGVTLCILLSSMAFARGEADHGAKVKALLGEMTLDEKIGQMVQADMNALKNKTDIQKYFLGSVLSGGSSDPADMTAQGWAKAVDEIQGQALQTRLKIPLLYGIDAVHGHNNVDGAVIFPHNIGLGATRNPDLVRQAAHITALELAGTGIRWAFAPCIAVARNERWGRTYESFGEHPEIAGLLGPAAVRGLQGDALSEKPDSILACAKHFLADGGTQDGIDQGNAVCDETKLREVHLPAYRTTIDAGVGSVMASYSSWNGQKMHGNRHLITDVLKGELGFQGIVISDWAAIDQLPGDYKSNVEASVNAGLDMIMIPYGPGEKNNYVEFITDLKELVAEGRVPRARIDDAVRRILTIKFKMGLFANAATDPALTAAVGSPEHRQVARECVRQSLVLLKNSNYALPLSKKLKRLVVVGAAADDLGIQCGGWTIDWQGRTGPVTHGGTTILAAIRQAVAPGTEVIFSPDGSNLNGAEGIVTVLGELPYAETKGDRSDLNLSADDIRLTETVKAAGVPTVTVLLSGRPFILGKALDASDAFLAAWLPGTEGQGVTDVLFGDYPPTGRLPRLWPSTMADISGPREGSAANHSLFPYGFGLGYTEGKLIANGATAKVP